MRMLWAVLKDSYHQTLDYKVLYVCLGISTLFLMLLSSIGFSTRSPEEGLRRLVSGERLGAKLIRYEELGKTGFRTRFRAVLEFDEPEQYLEALGRAELTAYQQKTMDWRMTTSTQRHGQGDDLKVVVTVFRNASDKEPVHQLTLDRTNINREMPRLLAYKFGRLGIANAHVSVSGEGWRKEVALTGETNDFTMGHSGEISLLFGLWKRDLDEVSVATVVWMIQVFLVDWIAGLGGTIFGIIVTAFFVPNMLQRGSIEMWLSRPIHRSVLLFYKYLGGMIFVFVNVVFLIGGAFLIMSVRSGYWNFAFLASGLVLMIFFAILYSVSVLFGVIFRSIVGVVVSIIMSFFTWFLGWLAYVLHNAVPELVDRGTVPKWVGPAADAFYFFMPKTSELKAINTYFLLMTSGVSEEMVGLAAVKQLAQISWSTTLGSTALFIAVMLGLAAWIFSTRDY